MEQTESKPTLLRCILEAALWSVMLVPISWVPSRLSISTAAMLAAGLAAVNALAVLIAAYNHWTNSRKLLFWVSLGVSVTWAIELTALSDQQFIDSLLALTTGPILGIWLLIDRWIIPRLSATKKASHAAEHSVASASRTELIEIARNPPISAASYPLHEQHHSEADESTFEESEDASPDVTQSITRSQTLNGDTIAGWMRIEFAEGQREATVHLSFCPPLSASPSIAVHDVDVIGLEIKVAASFAFGARLTVRRPLGHSATKSKLSQCVVRVGFSAFCAAATKAA